MKKLIILSLTALVFALPVTAQRKKKSKKGKAEVSAGLQNMNDSLGYALGISVGNNLLGEAPDSLSLEGFVAGFTDVFNKVTLKMDENAAKAYISEVVQRVNQAKSEKSKKEGADFLEANKTKEGVITTTSGLQYKILTKGDSTAFPDITDRVKVHYTGKLIDGTVFDSSVQRGQPATFPVNAVIRGWVEALQLMNVGDKFELYIPYDLAYDSRATGKIPAYSMLIFEVELLEIVK